MKSNDFHDYERTLAPKNLLVRITVIVFTFFTNHLSYSNASILSCLFCSILIYIYM